MSSDRVQWTLNEQLPAIVVVILAIAVFTGSPGGVAGRGEETVDDRVVQGASRAPVLTADQAIAVALKSEIGGNDVRVSETGADGDPFRDAKSAAVAYNSNSQEYLVVWQADDPLTGAIDDDYQIVGQRIDAVTGIEIGGQFRISDHVLGNREFGAFRPAVAYNSIDDEYLVVWDGDDDQGGLVEGESEIFGQRLNADPGSFGEVGANDFRISSMGSDGNLEFGAFRPAVVYNSVDNEYFVVWDGDDNRSPLVEGESEIFGQRLNASPISFGEVGSDDFRISDMGFDGNREFGAFRPAVAYNRFNNHYLVVWDGDDTTGPLVEGESEIFGQRLRAMGSDLGADFRISDMGPDGNRDFGAFFPAVVFDTADDYLVVWEGDDNTVGMGAPLVEGESEVFGQRLGAGGGHKGTNDFRISDMGSGGNRDFGAFRPAVVYDTRADEYLVVWQGGEDFGPPPGPVIPSSELEIFGQRLDLEGAELGDNDFRISDMGLIDGDPSYDAFEPVVAYNPQRGQSLVGWHGDDDTGALVDGELEVYVQLLGVVADLSIDKQAAVPTAVPGETLLIYTIEVTNAGPDDVSAASVHDMFPPSLDCRWTCDPSDGASCTTGPRLGDINDTVDLSVGSSAEYSVICTIDTGASGTVVNTATVTLPLGAMDPEPDNDASTAIVDLTPMADLRVAKWAGSPTAVPGESLSYTVSVFNSGPSDASAVSVVDNFPAELECTWSCAANAPGGFCNPGPQAGDINDMAVIPNGSSAIYSVFCDIAPEATGILVNIATATPPVGISDPMPDDNTDSVDVELTPMADLEIDKQGPTTAIPGQSLTYSLTVANPGPSDVSATVADSFPTFLDCEWTCVPNGAGADCKPGPQTGDILDDIQLPAGTSVDYSAECAIDPAASGDVVNTATVTVVGGTDPDPTNNEDTVTTELTPTADLSVTKSDSRLGAHPGDPIAYVVEASSAGPSDAPGTMVVDPLPVPFENAEWTCVASAGSTCPAMGTGDLDESVDLLVGGTATFTVTGTIASDFVGDLVNVVMVSTADGVVDPALRDNEATDVTTVTSPAEIVATKTVDGDFQVGGSIVYEVLLVNISPHAQFDDPASDEFVDNLPPELDPIGVSADSGDVTIDTGANLVTWNGSIPGGGEVAIAIEAVIAYGSDGELIVNQGEIFYDADGDGTNDTVVLTDDPVVGGDTDPTVIQVQDVIDVPVLSPSGVLVLVGLLAAAALIVLRRRAALLE